ncbi:hypothetical protein KDW_21560 [Dictyobacter vulcani]|uniref:Uncharacterized protein n=1 Tax=Dictyobacter vulcani TaxID=2607529 RepID=A0A5J4KF43_9CHLR|nr:hypothetical protein KDW_21560 [Dictyobacter vulcani]
MGAILKAWYWIGHLTFRDLGIELIGWFGFMEQLSRISIALCSALLHASYARNDQGLRRSAISFIAAIASRL